MKKTIAALSLAALMLTATTAFAKGPDNGDGGMGMRIGLFGHIGQGIEKRFVKQSKFIVTGTVVSTTASSVTLTVKAQVNSQVAVNSPATVNVSSTTKITKDKDTAEALADIKAGDQIAVSGTVSGTTLTATNIRVIAPHGKAFGTVTAVSATSVTITNNVTNTSQTFAVDGTTKVNVDGQAKTAADVQVGDKGFVKFRGEVSGLVAKFISLFR